MIYIVISGKTEKDESNGIEPGTPLFVKISGGGIGNQPILGFSSIELGEKYLKLKNIPLGSYQLVSIEEGLSVKYKDARVVLFTNEEQLLDVEKDSEGYDYEKRIYTNAL
tara:strand:+ start:243 stop:572 length:330 start_codon:yes stop_codon:yes gene_type:complete